MRGRCTLMMVVIGALAWTPAQAAPWPPARRADGEVWIMAADPMAAASGEVGLLVAGVARLVTDIPQTVCQSTADYAKKMLTEAGANGDAICERIDLVDPRDWTRVVVGQEPAPAGLEPGRQWVVRIRIDNPIALAREEKGAFTIGIARLFGMNIGGRVNQTVARVAAEAYHARKLDMLVKFTDR